MAEETSLYLCLWSMLLGGVYMFDPNYYTETPSPPTFMTMSGPTHVLVHINPDIHKFYADKIVDYYDKQNLSDFTAFCRCWRSRQFPYCDGFHRQHNELVGDNVGPIIVRKKNVTNGALFYRRLRRMTIATNVIGEPPLCTRTPKPTPSTKRRRPITEPEVDIDFMFKEYGHVIFNFTKYLKQILNTTNYIQLCLTEPPPTSPTTSAEPTLWYPSPMACDIIVDKQSTENQSGLGADTLEELKRYNIKKRRRRRKRCIKDVLFSKEK